MDVGSEVESLFSPPGYEEASDGGQFVRTVLRLIEIVVLIPLFLVLFAIMLPFIVMNFVYNVLALAFYAILVHSHHIRRDNPQLIADVSSQLQTLLFGRPTSIDFVPTVTRNHGS